MPHSFASNWQLSDSNQIQEVDLVNFTCLKEDKTEYVIVDVINYYIVWNYTMHNKLGPVKRICLRAFRHDKFQLRMPGHSVGPGIWLSVWRFLLTHCLYERAAEVLARLRGCAGSPEPSLLAYAISTKFAWRGPIQQYSLQVSGIPSLALLVCIMHEEPNLITCCVYTSVTSAC